MNRTDWLSIIIQAAMLMAFWLLLSGHYDFLHISFGIFSVILVLFINQPLRRHLVSLEAHSPTLKLNFWRLLYYIPWLLWQIVLASLQVAQAVLHPKCPIDPALLRFKTRLGNTSSRVILGNSITLTPGTITVDIADDEFLVHGLMDLSYSGILDDSLRGEVAKLYERKPGQALQNVEIIKSDDAL